MDADTQHMAHALEDLAEDARQRAAEIAGTQPGISLRRRIREELETLTLDSYGTLERAPLLHLLSRYPVTPYTYQVSELVARGHGDEDISATFRLKAELFERTNIMSMPSHGQA